MEHETLDEVTQRVLARFKGCDKHILFEHSCHWCNVKFTSYSRMTAQEREALGWTSSAWNIVYKRMVNAWD